MRLDCDVDCPWRREATRLLERVAQLHQALVRLTRETPYPDELEALIDQRRALLAEVGSLRARIAELEREKPP